MHMLKTPFSYRFIFQDVFPQFQAGALGNLEAFTSFNGPDFYGLTSKIVLRKSAWQAPATYEHSSGEIVPMFAGSTLEWLPSHDEPKEQTVCIIGRCTRGDQYVEFFQFIFPFLLESA